VASGTAVVSRNERSPQFGALFKFQQVFHEEIARINQRRALREDPRGAIELEREARDASGEWVWRPAQEASVIGLALSGGGIRSAAFCLGVLQALDTTKVLDRVDYMSTVSGGGYIGCSLTAAQEWSGQNGAPKFPFTSRLEEDEPPALQHIRDHSNYLFPHDFFIFSQKFVGSKSTDYVATEDIEDVAIGLDLATAMAASGAAVSSNMGAQSIKPLTATLALLNIRLGYWLRNPLRVTKAGARRAAGGRHFVTDFFRVRNVFANYYFLGEVFGQLSERRKSVYLTDGGHIENLGIYELLRRRCRVIIAVDAEADPQMAFGSFNALERYALIDLGVRIDLPWQQITDESLATGEAIDSKSDAPKDNGPHCAIGEISYPCGRKGILVYIKASLTGDENDYIFNYKTRYGAFPHETTLDQWFTEEQFEAYRALGFHAAYRLFDRSDMFAHLDPEQNPDVRPHLQVLDQLFPRVGTGGPPGQKQTFADWLPEKEASGLPA
jgi:hypothetical protein